MADTNVLVSALVFGGLPKSFVELAQDGRFTMLTSLDLLEELDRTLAGKFRIPPPKIHTMRGDIEDYAEVISIHLRVRAVAADPDDDRVLECALAGRADCIVSGDKHLLQLASFQHIPILTLRHFLDRLPPTT